MDEEASPSLPESLPARQRFTRLRAFLARSLRVTALVLLGLLVVLYMLQDRMIFPGSATQGTAEARIHPRPGTELVHFQTARGDQVAALYGPALASDGRPLSAPGDRPALVYFYGNAMCVAYAEPEFERFRRLGLNVLIPDFVGFGLSSGQASEIGCQETAEASLAFLKSRGFENRRILVGGWSLGGAVAIDLAARHRVGGLFAFSTFTSTREMAKGVFPLSLPSWFFVHRFDSLSKIPDVACPILLGHGRRDSLVPFPMFERLAASARAPLTRLVIDRADHNDFYDVGGRHIDDAIRQLVEQLPTP